MADNRIKAVRQFCVSVMVLCLAFFCVSVIQDMTGGGMGGGNGTDQVMDLQKAGTVPSHHFLP